MKKMTMRLTFHDYSRLESEKLSWNYGYKERVINENMFVLKIYYYHLLTIRIGFKAKMTFQTGRT